MYEVFYNLKAEPFRLSPDHRFCYEHSGYARARAYMAYAFMRAEGFVMITGRPGTGKTTLIGELVESLARDNVSAANLVCTQLEADDLLRTVAYHFGIAAEGADKAALLQQLETLFNRWQREGRRALLIVDEAQDLSVSAMEELRLLTNIQLNGQPLLQIFLLGQPELRELILSPALEQVHQRIVAASHLEGLEAEEVEAYVLHRLKKVGWSGDPAISKALFPLLHKYSEGIPRRINLICSRLFLHGGVEQRHAIDVEDLRVVLEELQSENLAAGTRIAAEDFEPSDQPEWVEKSAPPQQPPEAEQVEENEEAGEAEEAEEEPAQAGVHLRAVNDSGSEEAPGKPDPAAKKKDETDAGAVKAAPLVVADSKSTAAGSAPALFEAADPAAPAREYAVPSQPPAEPIPLFAEKPGSRVRSDSGPRGDNASIELAAAATPRAGDIRRTPRFLPFALIGLLLLLALVAAIFLLPLLEQRDRPLWDTLKEDVGDAPPTARQPASSDETAQTQAPVANEPPTALPDSPSAAVEGDDFTITSTGEPLLPSGQSAEYAPFEPVSDNNPAVVAGIDTNLSVDPESITEFGADIDRAGMLDVMPASVEEVIESPAATELARGFDDTDGQLEQPAEAPHGGDLTLLVGFAFDSVALSAAALDVLNEAARVMNEEWGSSAEIIGFADRSGNAVYNLDLSRDRATVVEEYLVAAGVERSRLRVEGRGATSDAIVDDVAADLSDEGVQDSERFRIVKINIRRPVQY